MATPTVKKARPYPSKVIHQGKEYTVAGWFDQTRYTLVEGKTKFAAEASECTEPKEKEKKEKGA